MKGGVFVISSIDEDGPWNATKEILTPHNDTFYTVENLRPFTVYSFRVAAINALGRSKPSQASYYMVTLRESKFSPCDFNSPPHEHTEMIGTAASRR